MRGRERAPGPGGRLREPETTGADATGADAAEPDGAGPGPTGAATWDPVRGLSLAALVVAGAACQAGESSPPVVRTDSAGVEVVTSRGEDVALSWTLHRELSLGGAEEGPEAFYRVNASTVATDGGRHLYVLDAPRSRVVQFTAAGAHVREFGRAGEGPGELASPGSLAVTPEGEVAVFDFGKGGLVRYDPDGEPLEPLPFRFFPWPGQNRHVAPSGDGWLVTTMVPSEVEGTFRHALLHVTGSDTTVVADHVFPRPGMVRYPSCGGGLNLPRIFEVQVTWSPFDGGVVVARSAGYGVEVYEDARLVRRIRRDLPPREATRELAMDELGDGFVINFGRGPCTIPPAEMVEGRGFAERLPWIRDVAVSPGGEVWVARKVVGSEEGPVDVFDASGAYLGTLPAATPVPVLFLDEQRFAAVETDALDVERLVVYRVSK